MKSRPGISAVMVTGKSTDRYPLARAAVFSFLKQEYSGPTELVIVNDNPTEPLFPDKKGVPDNIKEIWIPPKDDSRLTLGDLRNRTFEHAQYPYLVQWDDDDYPHPQRLDWQIKHTPPNAASVLMWQIKCNLCTGYAFDNCGKKMFPGGFPGTIIWPAHAGVKYLSRRRGEDTSFARDLKKAGIKIKPLKNQPALYTRFYHGFNTWSERHVMRPVRGVHPLSKRSKKWLDKLLNDPSLESLFLEYRRFD